MSQREIAASRPRMGLATESSVDIDRGDDGIYRVRYDRDGGDLTITITEALVAVGDLDPIDIVDNFSKYADPDALNRLFRRLPNGEPRAPGGHVHLSIEGYDVTIHSDGIIEIEP